MKLLVAVGLALVVPAPTALVRAEDDKPAEAVPMFAKPKEDPVVEEVGDERAEALLDALDKAVRAKDVDEILAALEPLITARHEDLVKPLAKLTRNRSADIRESAALALGSQGPLKKVAPILFKVLKNRGNKNEPQILAAAISSLRRVGFDNKAVTEECESHFRKVKDMGLMRECARYFGAFKKAEAFRLLVYWVEPPQPGNVNDPQNPPASYWKRLHGIWMATKLTVLAALKEITGEEFETQKEWREWARTREARRLGIK